MGSRPCSSGTVGCQPNACCGRAITSWRCNGSSAGSGCSISVSAGLIVLRTSTASCWIVYSPGIPKLIGTQWRPIHSRISPSIRSSTQQKLQGRLKVRHRAGGAAILVTFLSGLLPNLGSVLCQCGSDHSPSGPAGRPQTPRAALSPVAAAVDGDH